MTADYTLEGDNKYITFRNEVYFQNGKKLEGMIGTGRQIYKLDRTTLTYTHNSSHSSVYTFHRKGK